LVYNILVVKTALLFLVLLIITGEIHFQVQQGQVVKSVLAAETELDQEIGRLQNLKAYWEKIVSDSPTYRDGYVHLALIEQALGNTQAELENRAKIISVDPNFQPAQSQ